MSHLEDARRWSQSQCRALWRACDPAPVLAEGARVGNFVETKKANIGAGSKVNHLSYIGDCDMGAGVNVGAGHDYL